MSGNSQGKFIGHAPHEKCGSSDGLALYEKENGVIDGYCWACSEWQPSEVTEQARHSNLFVKTKSPEEIAQRLNDIYSNYSAKPLVDRGIRQDVLEYFGVRVGTDPSDSSKVIEHYYPYVAMDDKSLSAYKVRKVEDKQFYSIGKMQKTLLFGEYQAAHTGSKKVFITEGECDAMALYQVLMDQQKGTQWESYRPAVVSLSRGADKSEEATKVINELGEHIDFLNRFEEIIFVFDQDQPGENSARAASKLFPGKAKIANLPLKDANEMLLAGKGKELQRAVLFTAQAHKPSSIVTVEDVYEKARAKAQWGIKYPWPTLTRLTYGIRHELIGIGAGVGCGKTSFYHELESSLIGIGMKVGVFMLEESNAKTLKMLASKFAGINFHDPEAQYTQEQLDNALKSLSDKVLLYSHNEDRSWDSVKQAIRHMVLVEGVKVIILDPISAMTYMYDSSKTNDVLNGIFGELAGMVETLGFTCFYSSHLNPPESGPPHEEGGRVKAAQFTGSRAMIKWSHYIIGIERNTQAEDETTRNTATFRVLKDREYGNTGNFLVYYDKVHNTFLEPVYEKPTGVTY